MIEFKLSAYGNNTNAGKTAGSLTIALLSGNKNFTGYTVDGTFEIKPATVTGSSISVFDKYGQNVSTVYGFTTGTGDQQKRLHMMELPRHSHLLN